MIIHGAAAPGHMDIVCRSYDKLLEELDAK
jgi:hypothetical protein